VQPWLVLQAARAVPRACPLYVRAAVCVAVPPLALGGPFYPELTFTILYLQLVVLKAEPLNWGNSVLPLRVDIRSIDVVHTGTDWLSHPDRGSSLETPFTQSQEPTRSEFGRNIRTAQHWPDTSVPPTCSTVNALYDR
jgi:hypothetical protein